MNLVRHILVLDEADELLPESSCLPCAEIAPLMDETIEEVIRRAGWNTDLLPTVVRIGDLYYGRDEWPLTVVAPNDNVLVISRPAQSPGGGGGGGKAIMGAVAMIALAVLAPYAVAALGVAALGTTAGALTFAGNALAAALVAGGGLLISHFLKPKAARKANPEDSPLYSFGLGGNQAKPLQMIPVGYGRRLVTPDFAAPTYSEYSGDQMITYGLYAIGCGRYDVEELRLGDTTIWTAEGGPQGIGSTIEVELYEPGEQVDLFPVNVITSSDVSGQGMEHAVSGDENWVGPFAANPAGTLAKELLVDFVWPSGAGATYKDRTYAVTTHIRVQIRPIDAAGAPTGPWQTALDTGIGFAKTSQYRRTWRIPVTPGRYEVRAGVPDEPLGQSADGKITAHNDVVWSALRAHIDGPQSFPGVTTLAVKATADAGLQSVNNGKLGVVATRILPVWNGETWVEEPTRSIAWAAVDAWSNSQYSAGLPLGRVDLDTFAGYAEFWDDQDHTFDHWFTDSSSVVEAVETILKAGRAVPDIVGDTMTILRDEPRGIPEMLFTDREIVRGSVAIDYNLYNSQIADGVVGQYLDESTWRLAEVTSAPDEAILAKPAKVELTGVTKRAQAAGLVRFQAAENTYRRTSIDFAVEAEGMLVKRGMAIAIQTEEPQQWGAGGEVRDYVPLSRTLTLSPAPPWDADAPSHWIEIRTAEGGYWGPARVTQGAQPQLAILNASDVVSLATSLGLTVVEALARDADQELPSFVFAAGQPRAYRAIIKSGSPSGDNLTLSAVNDDERVYDVVETGVTPLPEVPPIYNLRVPEAITQISALMRQEGTSAVLICSWAPAAGAQRYLGQISYDGETWETVTTSEKTSARVIVTPVDLFFRVQGVNAVGDPGPMSQTAVAAIVLQINSDTVDIVLDFNALHPELVDRAITQQYITAADAEMRAFIDRANQIGVNEEIKYRIDQLTTGQEDGIFAAVTEERLAREAADGVLAGQIVTVQAQFADDIAAAVQTESIARASADSALAVQANTLTTTVNGHTATISTQQVSIDGLSTRYSLTLNADGAIAGFSAYAGGGVGIFAIQADLFYLWPQGGAAYSPFLVQSGVVYIKTGVIQDLTVDTIKIKDGALSASYAASGSGSASLDVTDCKIGDRFVVQMVATGASAGGGTLAGAPTGQTPINITTSFGDAPTIYALRVAYDSHTVTFGSGDSAYEVMQNDYAYPPTPHSYVAVADFNGTATFTGTGPGTVNLIVTRLKK